MVELKESAEENPRSGRMERGGIALKGWRPFGKVRKVEANREGRVQSGGVRGDGGIREKKVRV